MVDSYKPYISGITNYVDINKRYLEMAGHDVFVFTFGDLEYEDEEPRVIRSHGVPLADTGFYLSTRYSRAAKQLLQTMDIVHVHHPFLSGRLALKYCRPLNIPIIFTNHTRYDLYAQSRLPLLPDEVSNGLLQAYMPAFCKEMDLVISPSHGMEKILRQYGVETKVEVVPNGVDLMPFYTAKSLPRTRFGFKDCDILLVYAGRIAPEKNLEFLLQAFAGVSQVIPNIYLLIIGGGQKDHVEKIMSIPKNLNIQDRVLFTGIIPYNELPPYFAMCDIFVTASVTETFGMSTVEAMGAGLPVVGVQSPGTSDIIKDGETGYLSTKDISSFTAKLTYLCIKKSLFRKLGKAARASSKQYDIRRTTKNILKYYENLRLTRKSIKPSFDKHLHSILEKYMK